MKPELKAIIVEAESIIAAKEKIIYALKEQISIQKNGVD